MSNPNIKNFGFGSGNETKKQLDSRKNKRVHRWTKGFCIEQLNTLLDVIKKVLLDSEKLEKEDPKKLKNEVVRDAVTLMNKILDFMKYLYPPVQENLNVNVEMQLTDAIEIWKEKNKDIIIINEGEEEEEEEDE